MTANQKDHPEMRQAPAGGMVGLNGDFYKGGQFLPRSENTVKGQQAKIKASGKKEIGPYQWSVAPADDLLPIYDRIKHVIWELRKDTQYIKGQGFINLQVEPDSLLKNGKKLSSYGEFDLDQAGINFLTGLIDAFNAGERWFPLDLDLWHYKNDDNRREAYDYWTSQEPKIIANDGAESSVNWG